MRNNLPSALSPGQKLRAVDSLTMSTGVRAFTSFSENARPRTSGVPIVSRKAEGISSIATPEYCFGPVPPWLYLTFVALSHLVALSDFGGVIPPCGLSDFGAVTP